MNTATMNKEIRAHDRRSRARIPLNNVSHLERVQKQASIRRPWRLQTSFVLSSTISWRPRSTRRPVEIALDANSTTLQPCRRFLPLSEGAQRASAHSFCPLISAASNWKIRAPPLFSSREAWSHARERQSTRRPPVNARRRNRRDSARSLVP